MSSSSQFRSELRGGMRAFVEQQRQRFPEHETLEIDLHCHDHNSDVPDERLGRILRCPETWTRTEQVLDALEAAGMDAVTITNHNNARTCWSLLERGVDVLVGAEFTCTVPDHDARVHVLTYGFSPAQEQQLDELRFDLYRFLAYAREHELVTVLAHPLFFASGGVPPVELIEKLTLLFDSFEVVNGQRDSWQNLLMAAWLESLTGQRLEQLARAHGIPTDAYCRHPHRKGMTGGSDCHFGLYVGTSGTRVHVPDLARRLRTEARSALVLEGLREGRTAPFGAYVCEEKLSVTLLEFFCQAVMNLRDPGLVRMLLHLGPTEDKLLAFLVSNGLMELRRHKFTSRFLRTFHEAIHGKRPGFMLRRVIARPLRPLVRELDEIAVARRHDPQRYAERLYALMPRLYHELAQLLADRVTEKMRDIGPLPDATTPAGAASFIEKLEVPSSVRDLFSDDHSHTWHDVSPVNLAEWTDGLPFPFLGALVVGSASFASCKVLFQNRPLLDRFAAGIGRFQHPRRALWLTDTITDRNGVAGSIRLNLEQVRRRDLPIDFAVCSNELEPGEHLQVIRPMAEFTTPFYRDQPLRLPDLIQLQRLFVEGGYDRVICSTEAPMGLVALYLKHAMSVPAYFYLHTDWLDFARRTLEFNQRNLDRLRRMLRAFYRAQDGVFVLNSEQQQWLASEAMGVPRDRVHITAHWVDEAFRPRPVARDQVLPELGPQERAVLYAGRVSAEKGVTELPRIIARLRRQVPGARLVVAGTGPAEQQLARALPDVVLRGWLEREQLARLYAACDVMLLPSRFDTFACVVLEALSCGLPVVAYPVTGPRDIVEHGRCGFHAADAEQMAARAAHILTDPALARSMRAAAIARGQAYGAGPIMDAFLRDVGLPVPGPADAAREPSSPVVETAV